MTEPFQSTVSSVAELRTRYRAASKVAASKIQDSIDPVSAEFVAASPFVMVATSDANGTCDVSPRGGGPGFVKVLDERRLVIPDLNGNNLLDTMTNIVENGHVGTIFLVPGRDETLRINGRAWLTEDDAILDLFTEEFRRPTLAIGVEVEQLYLHCAKAFRRSELWHPDSWPSDGVPTGGDLLVSQMSMQDSAEEMQEYLEKSYVSGLDADRPLHVGDGA